MRRIYALVMLASVPAMASAQTTWQTKGEISAGVQQVENNSNSSKFSEYRDLRDNRVPFGFWFNALRPNGFFLEAAGTDITRRDQAFSLTLGMPGTWRINALWSELPHNLSNKAVSPYTATAPGRLDVAQTMAIPFKKLATSAADTTGVLLSDVVAAAYAQANARPIDLANQSRTGAIEVRYTGVQALTLSAGYKQRTKTGSHPSYGPIGDRPPRTLNIQLAEPLDYVTGDFTAAAEYVLPQYQIRAEYLLSNFENEIDVLEWRNVWASAPAGSTFDTWDRAIGTWGRRPLAPDNKYHLATLTGGVALPFDSRLSATIAKGALDQNAELVPYAYQVDMLANKTLPRSTADARMNTTQLSAEYFIAPMQRVNVRAFYRRYDLDNETPSAQWQYVTQDATGLAGTVAYVNKRQNEPISWNRDNIGLETTFRLRVMNSSLVLGAEREEIDREHRQAEHVKENTLRASWRARPAKWFSLRTTYQRGMRDGGVYDWRSPSESYWYTAAEATDNNDPKFSFEDHPDMRKFDMADRERNRYDLTLTFTPSANLSISTGLRYRKDDYDSDVTSVQPLLGLAVADAAAATPGDQLGLLGSKSRQMTLDLTYTPTERLSLNASYGYDVGESNSRGLEFNENNKKNPSAVNTSVLGPWTRATSQWTAAFDDRTRFAGIGGSYEVVPGKVTAEANYTMSLSDYDIGYAGFGVVSFDGTPFAPNYQFAFPPQPPVEQNAHAATFALNFPLFRNSDARLSWHYESYSIRDWQQDVGTAINEPVGTPLFLRDTSRSFQWGNRLYNMGSYLAPSFTGHAVYFGFSYRFDGGTPAR